MNIPFHVVADSFARNGDDRLDFDAVRRPRRLAPRPVEADGGRVAADLAWFWNSNEAWADEQIAISDAYAALAAQVVADVGLAPGDEVLIPASEPAERRAAWTDALPEGATLREWRVAPEPPPASPEPVLTARTRLVVMAKACAVTGAISEAIPVARRLADAGARLVLEVSHFLAHGPLDVRTLRADAVIASADELFGASGAVLWSKQPTGAADGTASPETLASLRRVMGYVERLGSEPGGLPVPPSDRYLRRESMRRAMQGIRQEERILTRRLLAGLRETPGVRVVGRNDPWDAARRTPVASFVVEGTPARELADALLGRDVEVSAGDLDAPEAVRQAGLDPGTGVARASLAHYHSPADIRRFLDALRDLI